MELASASEPCFCLGVTDWRKSTGEIDSIISWCRGGIGLRRGRDDKNLRFDLGVVGVRVVEWGTRLGKWHAVGLVARGWASGTRLGQ